jgi:ribonuclease P protein component
LNKKLVTLKRNKEFNFVYRKGKSFFTQHLSMIFFQNKYGGLRYGFSISKKVGKAVVRNKVRRRLKSICRDIMKDNEIGLSANIIFVAKKDIQNVRYDVLSSEVIHLMKKAKIL